MVFLTGQPFPEGFGATVHFLWPSKTNPQWVYLGILSNEKPSAIFKLGGTKNQSKSVDNLMDEDGPFQATSQTIAQIGISIEPIANVLAMQASATSNQLVLRNSVVDTTQMALKLLENFYNYCSSFCTTLPSSAAILFSMPNAQNMFIPLKVFDINQAFQDWYKNITHKAENDPQLMRDMEM